MGNPSNRARVVENKRLEQDKGGHVRSSYGTPLTVEETYSFEHPKDGSHEPTTAIEHNPFYMAPGMAVGFSNGLYGKGMRKSPPDPDINEGGRQWGDPDDEDDWYC